MYLHVEGLNMSQAFHRSVDKYPDQIAQLFNPDLYYGDNNGVFTWKEVRARSKRLPVDFSL